MLGGEPGGDERSVARLRIALDAEQSARAIGRQLARQALDADRVEDLLDVAAGVLGRELDAGSRADALARVLGVLKMTELGRWRQLEMVPVLDSCLRQRLLESR